MNLQNVISKQTLVLLLTVTFLAGCGETAPKKTADDKPANGEETEKDKEKEKSTEAVDPHDIPLTDEDKAQLRKENEKYSDAIAHIKAYRDTIRDETTGGNPAKAHRALDNLNVVLELLKEIAPKSGVPKSSWEEVNTAAQNLRDLFDKVHEKIDAGEDPDYKSFAAEIDEAVDALAAIKSE